MVGTAIAFTVMMNAVLYVAADPLKMLLSTALGAVAAHAVFFTVIIVHLIFSFLLTSSLVCPFDSSVFMERERF